MLTLMPCNTWDINAFSRQPNAQNSGSPRWKKIEINPALIQGKNIDNWICCAPIWVLPDYFEMLKAYGAKRIVAMSSTSVFTKANSSDSNEHHVVAQLIDGETRLRMWANENGIEWVILRPTMIFGYGKDKNIAEIARFINRFGFFPVLGKAKGLRQPIHAEDVARACIASLESTTATNKSYNLSGRETLTYKKMLDHVFHAMNRKPRVIVFPLMIVKVAIALLQSLSRYRHWSPSMAERMNLDLVFDSSEAKRDFGYEPKPFCLKKTDLP